LKPSMNCLPYPATRPLVEVSTPTLTGDPPPDEPEAEVSSPPDDPHAVRVRASSAERATPYRFMRTLLFEGSGTSRGPAMGTRRNRPSVRRPRGPASGGRLRPAFGETTHRPAQGDG